MPFIEKFLIVAVLGIGCVVAAVEVCFCVDLILCRVIKNRKKSPILSKPAIAAHVIAAAGVLCFCYGYFIEAYWLQVNHFTVETDKLHDASFRIVQITDTHCDPKIRNENKMVEIINSLNPDVIVFTGDAINTPEAMTNFKNAMTELNASLAKIAIRGNWFKWIDDDDLFSGTGFEVLDCDKMKIEKDGECIEFAGLNFFNPAGYDRLLRNNSTDCYNVFLYHTPDLIEDVWQYDVNMYLAGHTHGGQVCLPFYGAILTFSKFGKKYEAGLYNVGDTTLYVNRGVGMEGGKAPRVRFFARPEIAVFDIVPEGKAN